MKSEGLNLRGCCDLQCFYDHSQERYYRGKFMKDFQPFVRPLNSQNVFACIHYSAGDGSGLRKVENHWTKEPFWSHVGVGRLANDNDVHILSLSIYIYVSLQFTRTHSRPQPKNHNPPTVLRSIYLKMFLFVSIMNISAAVPDLYQLRWRISTRRVLISAAQKCSSVLFFIRFQISDSCSSFLFFL